MSRRWLVCFALYVSGAACGNDHALIDAPSAADAGPDAEPADCVEAAQHSDLTWIKSNVFTRQCVFSGCHDGGQGSAGEMDLHPDTAYASIVNHTSYLCPQTDIVTAGSAGSSYMLVMLGQLTPDEETPPACAVRQDIGLMPQGNPTVLLCQPKRDAIQRWIAAGAQDD